MIHFMITTEHNSSHLPSPKLLITLVAIFALVVLGFMLPVRDMAQQAISWIEHLGAWGYAAMIVAYITACVLFVPGSLLTLASGALFGVVAGTAVVSAGSTLGAGAAFLVGRYLARDFVERKITGNARFAALDESVGARGFKIVLLTRLSPVFPFNLLNYAFGLTRVSFRSYILASWIGMFPATLMYVYLGSTAKDLAHIFSGELKTSPAQSAMKIVGLAATIAVTVYVTRVARQALGASLPVLSEQSGDSSNGGSTDHGDSAAS